MSFLFVPILRLGIRATLPCMLDKVSLEVVYLRQTCSAGACGLHSLHQGVLRTKVLTLSPRTFSDERGRSCRTTRPGRPPVICPGISSTTIGRCAAPTGRSRPKSASVRRRA